MEKNVCTKIVEIKLQIDGERESRSDCRYAQSTEERQRLQKGGGWLTQMRILKYDNALVLLMPVEWEGGIPNRR